VDVFGNPVTAKKGKEVQLPAGPGTKQGSSPDILVSAVEGIPKFVGGKVIVEEALAIHGDIDFGSGNVDFIGSVTIKGTVMTGFKVKAGGDVHCEGVVEGAYIEAKGNVILRAGVKGQGKAVIKADGDVIAKFIESSKVFAGGSVIVDEAILTSDVQAAEEVDCVGKKGWITGGTITAGSSVKCMVMGSEVESETLVEVGSDHRLVQEMQQLKKDLDDLAPKFKQFSNLMAQLDKLQADGSIAEPKKELRKKLAGTVEQVTKDYEEKKERLAEIQELITSKGEGKISVMGTAYPGVRVTIANITRRLQEPIKRAVFIRKGNEIYISNE
jgi:hypothetical protein